MVRAIPPLTTRRHEATTSPTPPVPTRESESSTASWTPLVADTFETNAPSAPVDDRQHAPSASALLASSTSSPMAVQLASAHRTPRDEVAFEVRALKTRLTLAAAALPEAARPAFERATSESAARIQTSFDAGRIDVVEARRAMKMLQEIASVLIEMEAGRADVSTPDAASAASDMRAVLVRATTGDVLRVSVRATGGAAGEARVKLENVVDDGTPVPSSDRMMVRFDLAGSRDAGDEVRAAVDVQFGHERFDPANPTYERLNKRIHGVLLDVHGQPQVTRGGSTVPDHHFTDGIPDALHDKDGFAAFADEFLASLAPDDGAPEEASP